MPTATLSSRSRTFPTLPGVCRQAPDPQYRHLCGRVRRVSAQYRVQQGVHTVAAGPHRAATLPSTVPPASPPILINPHEHRVIDTSHRDLVRVYILGTSGFNVTTINPATVELNGALPIAHYTRHFPHSEFLNEVFVFVGSDIHLPPGYTTATFTAKTFSGQQITTSKQVLNIPFSAKVPGHLHFLLDKGSVYPHLRRLERTIRARSRLVARPSPFRPRSRST